MMWFWKMAVSFDMIELYDGVEKEHVKKTRKSLVLVIFAAQFQPAMSFN